MSFAPRPAVAFEAIVLALSLCSCGAAVDQPRADAAIADTAVSDAPATDATTDVLDGANLEEPDSGASSGNEAGDDVIDGGGGDVADGSPQVKCPAAEPNASDSCGWAAGLQCTYPDKCGGFGCNDSFTCVGGHYQAYACSYALICARVGAAPKTGDSCACGTGYSVHYYGESGPCRFECVEGPLTATCDPKTEKWTVSGPGTCTPLPDAGATDASRE